MWLSLLLLLLVIKISFALNAINKTPETFSLTDVFIENYAGSLRLFLFFLFFGNQAPISQAQTPGRRRLKIRALALALALAQASGGIHREKVCSSLSLI